MKKPAAKTAAKKATPFVPVSQGQQRRQHQRQMARLAHWKPVTVAVQKAQHKTAVHKAAVAHRKHAAKAKQARIAARIAARRGWTPDGDVACCSARAVAESLRLTLGVTVADADVLALHVAAGGHPDYGASLLDVLRAAQEHGLAGHRPVAFECIGGPLHEVNERLILGTDLPEPHALVADGGTWWSWGERHSPAEWPDAVIEEAWQVTW